MVEKASDIGAYSKSILIQLFPFQPSSQENNNLNSVSGMVDANVVPSNRDRKFSCFYLGFKFDSEYIVYILCGIAFDFNYKRGTIFDTHCNSVSVLGM